MNVAGAHDRNVVRNTQARLGNRFHRANRDPIVVAEDAIGDGIGLEKFAHRAISAAVAMARTHHVAWRHSYIVLLQRMPVASESSGGDADSWTPQVCDAAATQTNQ